MPGYVPAYFRLRSFNYVDAITSEHCRPDWYRLRDGHQCATTTPESSVATPAVKEQQAIADYLDRETAEIDAFIADQEELIGLLNERRAATITQAVTKGLDLTRPMRDSGIEWLGEVP